MIQCNLAGNKNGFCNFDLVLCEKIHLVIWALTQVWVMIEPTKYKYVPTRYSTSSCQIIEGSKLDCNYNIHMELLDNNICRDANIYGLIVNSGGATVNKKPILNNLSASAYDLNVLLTVLDVQIIWQMEVLRMKDV